MSGEGSSYGTGYGLVYGTPLAGRVGECRCLWRLPIHGLVYREGAEGLKRSRTAVNDLADTTIEKMMATNSTAAAGVDARRRTVRLSAGVIAAFTLALLIWAGQDPATFATEVGLGADIPPSGWIAAGLAAAVYAVYTLWAVPEIRSVVLEASWFRALAVPLALGSGLIEEMFFRHWLMSWFSAIGLGTVLQVVVSALIFAAVHTVWVVFGRSWRAVLPILLSTFGLGVLMSLVYLASGRVVLPAVVAHVAINLVIEPGLLLSSVRHTVARRSALT